MGVQRVRGKGGNVGTRQETLNMNIAAMAYRAKIREEPPMDALELDPLSYISFLRLHLFSRLGTTNAE